MLGNGCPIECYSPAENTRFESAKRLAINEFGDREPSWLVAEARQNGAVPANRRTWNWMAPFKAAALKVAAMLF